MKRRQLFWLIERSVPGEMFHEQLKAIRFPPGRRPTQYIFEPNANHPQVFATEAEARTTISHMPADLRAVCRAVEMP